MTQNADLLDRVKAGWVDPNPRCPECKSPDPRGQAPMFHPEHKWQPCPALVPGGEECGCTVGVQEWSIPAWLT